MALRILLEVTKNDIRIVNHPTDGRLKRVLIPRGAAPQNRAIRLEDGAAGAIPGAPVAGTANKGNLFMSADGSEDYNTNTSRGWAIDLPIKLAERLNRYLHFKSTIRQVGHNNGNSNIDLRNLVYNGAVGATGSNTNRFVGRCVPGTGAVDGTAAANTAIIIDGVNIPETSINTRAGWENIFQFFSVDNTQDFGDVDYKPADQNPRDLKWELDAFWETETFFERLTNEYDGKTIPDLTKVRNDIEELELYEGGLSGHSYKHDDGNDVTLKSGGVTDTIANFLGLDPTASADNAAKRKELAKKALFDTEISDNANSNVTYYQDFVTKWLRRLRELEIWKKVAGFDSIEEILMLNAAGFTITDRAGGAGGLTNVAASVLDISVQEKVGAIAGTNLTVKNYFPNPDKKYKGNIDILSLIKNEKKIKVEDHNANDDGVHIFNRQGNANATVINKANVDNFFKVFYDVTKKNKQDFRGFYFGDTFAITPGDEADLAGKKDAKKATYKTFDIFNTTTEVEGWENGHAIKFADLAGAASQKKKIKYNELTKTCFDILAATDVNGVVTLLHNSDFAEVSGNNQRLEVLKKAYICAQHAKAGATVHAYQENEANKKRIDDVYKKMEEFLGVFDVDYGSWDKSRANELKDANDKLTKYYEDPDFGSWKDKISGKKNEITAALLKDSPGGPKITAATINSARGSIGWSSDQKEDIKKMFDDNQSEIIAGGQPLLNEVKALAEKIDKALKDGNQVGKKELAAFEGGDANKKKAWEYAQKIKVDGRGLGDLAKEKATKKEDDDAEVAAAKTKALTDLKADMPTGGEQAFNLMIKDNTALTSKTAVEDVVKIFKKCHEAWKKGSDDADLRKELDNFKTKNPTGWAAVNKFGKNHENKDHTEGFATGALNHLLSLVKSRQKEVKESGITTADTTSKIDESLKKLKGSTDNDVKTKVVPRVELMLALSKKGDSKATELMKLIRDNFVETLETDYQDSTYDANLTKLEGKLAELKKYKDGEHESVYKGLGSTEKNVFDNLIKSVQAKVDSMKEAKKNKEKTNEEETPAPPWYKQWYGILLIIAIVAAALGAIVWLIKSNNSEEGEEESE